MNYYDDNSSFDQLPDSPLHSGAATPTPSAAGSQYYMSNSIYNAFGGLIRRLSSDRAGSLHQYSSRINIDSSGNSSLLPPTHSSPGYTFHRHDCLPPQPLQQNNEISQANSSASSFTRTASHIYPPPLEPLALSGFHKSTPDSAKLLTPSIAEEIRIMVPERLRIEDEWRLVYSLDQDGASLTTLYEKCARYAEYRSGFILVIQDDEDGIFGAYLSEYPHPSSHYFGTGECFLWRASPLATPLGCATTVPGTPTSLASYACPHISIHASPHSSYTVSAASRAFTPSMVSSSKSPSGSPDFPFQEQQPTRQPSSPSIRFTAFPYSGVNEYFIYCENNSLSIGGGDGKYGLWLNDSLEKGVSSVCLTFGNQPLSGQGEKFSVLGIEVWAIGSR